MKKILFFAMALVSITMTAQTYTVTGTVTDTSGNPMVGVNIMEAGTTSGGITGLDGVYALELEKGERTLIFSYLSYKTVEQVLTVDKNLRVDIVLEVNPESLDEVLVRSVRVRADSPITHSNLTSEEIQKRNLGQDIATQLNFLPNVVTTSDAGAGIGYTGFRVRGTANQGINVTINGIPYNDAESATSFFVNLQDFSSSVENLQLQRGVGTSTNGPGAFGASLNILTDAVSDEAYGETSHSVGSFKTRRHNVKFSTGLMQNKLEFSGRLSQIMSDGFLDRSASDLKSYFLQAAYKDENTLLKAIHFAGSEITQQAWFGVDRTTAENNPTFNPAGQFTDENGNIRFHENQVDNYKQDHYQLHWNQRYDNNWSSQMSFNYTYGRGFFEEYKEDEALEFYNINGPTVGGETVTTSDLIRRRWLDNDYYVGSLSVNYKDNTLDLNTGLFYSNYVGDHFGEVIWARFAGDSEIGDRYYFGVGKKNEFAAYAKATVRLDEKLSIFGDVQGRFVDYSTTGQNSDVADFIVDENFAFFNPKFGATYKFNTENQLYASYAVANREPNRTDFENGNPEAERLNDIELGWRFAKENIKLNVNGYYMSYRNQLVLTGALDISGAPIRANSGKSYRLGVEVDAAVQVTDWLSVYPNIALSTNQNVDFVFQRDGVLQNLGNTEISYSPSVVAGNTLRFKPFKNFEISLLSKYVGEQFMSNIESNTSILDAFFINDLNFVYTIDTLPLIKSVTFNALINNLFDVRYISNGYFFTFDDDFTDPNTITTVEGAGFYPQAGINFLVGATVRF